MAGTDAQARQRLFVAVEVPGSVAARLDAALVGLRAAAPSLRWTDSASWHVTVAFLGWVGESRIPALEAAVAAVAGQHPPLAVGLDGALGAFGRSVLWAGLSASPGMADLARACRAALSGQGLFDEDRPFHAHLTLARAARGASIPRRLVQDWRGPRDDWTVSRLALMRSDGRRGRGGYPVRSVWPLGDSAG